MRSNRVMNEVVALFLYGLALAGYLQEYTSAKAMGSSAPFYGLR